MSYITQCHFSVFLLSDNGNNGKVALAIFNRVPCACHMFAIDLHHTLQLQSLSKTVQVMLRDSDGILHVQQIQELVSHLGGDNICETGRFEQQVVCKSKAKQ